MAAVNRFSPEIMELGIIGTPPDGGISIGHASIQDLDSINWQIRNTHCRLGLATYEAPITANVTVLDRERGLNSLIIVRRINCNKDIECVKFTESKFRPKLGSSLKLATPDHYRKGAEGIANEIYDPEDGTQVRTFNPHWRNNFSAENFASMLWNCSGRVTLKCLDEPLVFCTSIRPYGEVEFRKLSRFFQNQCDYDSVVRIPDPGAFAIRLGIEFASLNGFPGYVESNAISRFVYDRASVNCQLWGSPRQIDRIINVYHGPVVYQDESGEWPVKKDYRSLSDGIYSTFTKRTKFQDQAEYRFAVSPLGSVVMEELLLPVTKDIARLITAIR